MRLRLARRRTLREDRRQCLRLAGAINRQRRGIANIERAQDIAERGPGIKGRAVDGGNHVACLEARFLCRGAGFNFDDVGALRQFRTVLRGFRGIQRVYLHAEVRTGGDDRTVALADERPGDLLRFVDRDREVQALCIVVPNAERVQADHLPIDVEEWAAAIAVIDRGVRLNEANVGIELPVDAGDDAFGDGVLQRFRAADGDDLLARLDGGGIAQFRDRRRLRRINLNDRDIIGGIAPNERATDTRAVRQFYVYRGRTLNDMVVGENQARFVVDDAAAEAGINRLIRAAAGRRRRYAAGRSAPARIVFLLVDDGNDRRTDLRDDLLRRHRGTARRRGSVAGDRAGVRRRRRGGRELLYLRGENATASTTEHRARAEGKAERDDEREKPTENTETSHRILCHPRRSIRAKISFLFHRALSGVPSVVVSKAYHPEVHLSDS